jgi:hypothetical protein
MAVTLVPLHSEFDRLPMVKPRQNLAYINAFSDRSGCDKAVKFTVQGY